MLTRALAAALETADLVRAREVVRDAPAAALDEVLEVLARHAASEVEATAATAVELLVEELERSGTLRRFAGAALVDEAAVDDVVQESLIAVARAAPGFRGRSKVTTWAHRIVRNCVVDHLRAQRAVAPLPEEAGAPGVRMSSVIATRTTVHEAIASLPEHYRDAVSLRDLHGLPYAEIAERLGRAEGTVKAQVSRGRALIAARVGEAESGARQQ